MAMNNHRRWLQLCAVLGATRNVESSFRRIAQLYRTPKRAYHNLTHVEHCLGEFDAVRKAATNPAAVEASIWFHDAVYDSKASDNEEKSALVASETLKGMGVHARLSKSVSRLILDTKHIGIPRTMDGKIIADIDLAILGQSAAMFAEYERKIRKEYGWVPESIFWPKRAKFQQVLVRRNRVFYTDFFFAKYESKARNNMNQSLSRIAGIGSRRS